MTKASKETVLLTVADYLAKQVKIQKTLGKTVQQIATEAGYERPNIIEMMCKGDVKVPIDKAPAIARALHVNPSVLARLVLQQYWPKSSGSIAEFLGPHVTNNEIKILEVVRSATGHSDPVITPALECKLRDCFE